MDVELTLPYDVTGVGGASNSIKEAKLTMSDDISEVVPTGVLRFGFGWATPPTMVLTVPLIVFGKSSGDVLNVHAAMVASDVPEGKRSLWKTLLVTPISTLYASPANSSSDLFCAFQP